MSPAVAAGGVLVDGQTTPAASCDLKIAAGWLQCHCDVCMHGHHM